MVRGDEARARARGLAVYALADPDGLVTIGTNVAIALDAAADFCGGFPHDLGEVPRSIIAGGHSIRVAVGVEVVISGASARDVRGRRAGDSRAFQRVGVLAVPGLHRVLGPEVPRRPAEGVLPVPVLLSVTRGSCIALGRITRLCIVLVHQMLDWPLRALPALQFGARLPTRKLI